MSPATTNCPGTGIPEGSFPVSMKFGWHGGTHLHAPAVGQTLLPLRCIADGEIIYARRPTARSNDTTHPQNYNPYGTSMAWTDNGMVIIRHVTDIGTGNNAKGIAYYSLINHLAELKGNCLKFANGTTTADEKNISRKELIGFAGHIYGAADHVHMEIVCDDANLERFVGRSSNKSNIESDGRTDAVYGEIYFHLPIGTNFYQNRPTDIVTTPTGPIGHTTVQPIVVGLRYCNGDGPHPGDAYLSTYSTDGKTIGNPPLREPDAEYDLLVRATAIAESHKGYHGSAISTISALYEMLRFGRTIGPDTLNPATTPHWRRANHPSGAGWVNLNAQGVFKFSDADFPAFKGWSLISDDIDKDSRCNSTALINIVKQSSSAKSLDRTELERQLSLPEVQTSLSGAIAKFPSEWNRGTIDERWSWLQNHPDYGLDAEGWRALREHINALCVPAESLPQELRTAHWHFHPRRFIAHIRQCSWLSAAEMAQTLPKYLFYTGDGNPRTAVTNPKQALTRAEANTRLARHGIALNQCIRKYIGPDKQRLAIFLAQVILETAHWRDLNQNCRLMHEWYYGQYTPKNPATQYYSAFYGRGIMQLTWAGNYKAYGDFRALPNHTGRYVERLSSTPPRITAESRHYDFNPSDKGKLFTWSPRFDPDLIGEDPYAACDSGGHYWVGKHYAGHININRTCDEEFTPTSIGLVNRLVNGGGNGYYERQAYAAYLMRLLTEDVSTETVRQITLPAPKTPIAVNFSRT
jgi:predicted chitinase